MMNILTKEFDCEIVKLYYQKILYLLTLFIYSFIIFVFLLYNFWFRDNTSYFSLQIFLSFWLAKITYITDSS